MPTRSDLPTETIECPLCLGAGKLKRTEILDRLGVKDLARVAQLSAEEAFRLLTQVARKHSISRASVCRMMKEASGNSPSVPPLQDAAVGQEARL